MNQLRTFKGHTKTLLDFGGYKSIKDARKKLNFEGTNKELYEDILVEYNDAVKEVQKAERRAKREEAKLKETVKQVNTIQQLYKVVKDAFESKKQFDFKFITEKGNIKADFNFTSADTLENTWSKILYLIQVESGKYLFDIYNGDQNDYTEGELGHAFIQSGKKLAPADKIQQAFFDGKINCVMMPIINFIQDKIDNSKADKTKSNYKTMMKKAIELETKYHNVGVNKDAMIEISNDLKIDLHVHLPFQKDFIVAKSNSKALRTFQYRNTKLNHVDFDELTHNEVEQIVSLEELINIQKKLDAEKAYYTYQKSYKNITQIDTLNCRYKLKNDYRDAVFKFETETGLMDCKICSIQQPELTAFVRQSSHFNETIIFNENEHDGHIDMRRAYANFKTCKYYKGFLGKVTDFRECNRIIDIGIYQIKNLVLNGRIKLMNDKLNCYNDNVYPSVELEMLMSEGCTFDIIAGCWGSSIDFEFNDELLDGKDEHKTRYYCKYVGQMYCYNQEHSYYIKSDEKFVQHLRNEIDTDITLYENEAKISYPKSSNYQLTHICPFILSYMRMNVIEQLYEFDMKNVIKIVVDGIYFNGSFPTLKNCFRDETKRMVHNYCGNSYVSNNNCGEFKYGKFREHNLIEVHSGAGGCGKTHINLVDNGFVGVVYFAPSWKLARTKQKEYGCNVNTIAKLLSNDPETLGYITRNMRVAIVDEGSMISERDKQTIIKNLSGCKIIFCGDFGYQLPCFEKDEEGKYLAPFNTTGMIIKEHNTNYRVKCNQLSELLKDVRDHIKNGINPRKLIESVCHKGNVNDYDYLNDLIITQTHTNKDAFTETFKHLNKYYILESNRVYGRGEIYFTVPDANHQIQHAFTVHSIQGETAQGKLYIDFAKMFNPQMLYTAISRAKYLHQIVLI